MAVPVSSSQKELLAAVADTNFPPWDALYRGPTIPAVDTNTLHDERARITASVVARDIDLSLGCVLEAYARFLQALTGHERVAFRARCTAAPPVDTVVCATRTDENAILVVDQFDLPLVSETTLGFAVNITSNAAALLAQERFCLELSRYAEHVDVSIDFQRSLLSSKDAGHIFTTLLRYLQVTTSAPESSVLNFPPLTRPPAPYFGSDKSDCSLLHREFERKAREYPDRSAVDFLQAHATEDAPSKHLILTYAQLDRITTNLACKIAASVGEQEGKLVVVPVFFSTSPELYISYLAVLKAGLAFCPLPTDAPPERLQNILEDLQPQLILGSGAIQPRWIAVDQPVRWIDVSEQVRSDLKSQAVLCLPSCRSATENDVAYVMYTSGSTGKPKGVQITHLAAACSIASHAVVAPIQQSEEVPRWFQFAAPTFDPSLMEIFVTLSSGGTLCSAPRDMSLTDMEATITELRATVMMSTPSMAALLRPSMLPTLRNLWTMGETLLRKVIDDFSNATDSSSRSKVVNAYGPTEAAINCTLLPDFPTGDRGSIIGPALPTCSLFVIEPHSRTPIPVPRGFVGELAIGGPQVSIGYINRPDQNERAFVESKEFGRLYRTGDMARVVTDRDGRLVVEFLGRIDTSEVKLSGRRVNLGEIDGVLSPCDGIKDVVTTSYQRNVAQAGSEEAVAFVVLEPTFAGSADAVESACRDRCARLLPSFMHPSKYFYLSSIPRSSSGKVDRKALSQLAREMWEAPGDVQSQTSEASDKSTVDNTSIESYDDLTMDLCGTLANLVGCQLDDVKPTTNLRSIGVDSLRAVRLLQILREANVSKLSVADILSSHTPHDLARHINDRLKEGSDVHTAGDELQDELAAFQERHLQQCSENLGIPAAEIESILPTTATQSGMLASFLRSSHETGKTYIHHSVHNLTNVDIPRLQQCWSAVMARNAIFRTIFAPTDDALSPFLQCSISSAAPRANFDWQIFENESLEQTIKEIEATITLDHPFSLALVATKRAVLSMFHGLFDGASLQLLFEEIEAEYNGQTAPPRTQISTAVSSHFRQATAETTKYWQQRLENHDPAPFPCLTGIKPDKAAKRTDSATIMSSINLDRLRDGSKCNMASPLSVLQAAWSLILLAYKDSLGDVAFGSVISGRLDTDSEVCMGPTLTTIPVSIPTTTITKEGIVSSNSAVTQYLSHVNAESLRYLHIPLASLTTASGGLHYDTLLAFQEFATSKSTCSLWEAVEYPPMRNDFAVMIEIWPESSGFLRLRATYSDAVLDERCAEMMLQQLEDAIVFILDHPDEPFLNGRSSSTSPRLSLSDPVSAQADSTELLHTSFETAATNHPEAIALEFRDSIEESADNVTWTYFELDQRANSLAQYLTRKFGDLRDKVIPFCLFKSPELYVAILGILKAGAAWCPIDPTFPPRRRHDLIVRTDAKMLLVADKTSLQEQDALPDDVDMIDLRTIPSHPEEIKIKADPSNMAYLIWTSGTTGVPKGVQIEHRAAARSMQSLRALIPRSKSDTVRCLQFSQPTFDVFVQDLFYTWGHGGTVISSSKELMLGSFAHLANATAATHAHLAPAFATTVQRKECKTLEVITMIGEALPQSVADDWGTDMLAYNTYGPAEVSVVSTVTKFGGPESTTKSINVGWPLPSVALSVLTAGGRPIMKGGVGELALSGPQLARGYWKDPERTSERFKRNDDVNDDVYMTGDMVRQLCDGSLEFVGRRDDLVKLSGVRVELSEISFALQDCHPSVEQVVIMLLSSSRRPKKVLTAFVSAPSLQPGTQPLLDDNAVAVAAAAADTAHKILPEHMVPSVFIVLGGIPCTASAKIDRAALQAAYEDFDVESWESKMSPTAKSEWTATEASFISTIAEFSGSSIGAIGRASRLPALGIDSIGAVKLASRLNSKGFSIAVIDVIRCSTITDLLTLLEVSQSRSVLVAPDVKYSVFHGKWSAPVALHLKISSEAFSVLPTLPIQDNLLSESYRQFDSYWSNHFFELHDDVELARLRDAWTLVAENNEALRTGFVLTASLTDAPEEDNAPTFLQVVYGEARVDWVQQTTTDAEFAAAARSRSQDISKQHQTSMFRDPCWAVTVFERGTSRTMMLTIHHSLHDGPALTTLQFELESAYEGVKSLPRTQICDAVALVSTSTGSTAEDLAFWESQLKDVRPDEAPTDGAKIAVSNKYHTAQAQMSLPATELRAALQDLEGPSIASIARAAWGCILAEFLETDNDTVIFGEVLSERILDSSLESAIAPLISVAPVVITATGSARDILTASNKAALSAWKHRHISPTIIRKILKKPQNQPLYPAVFAFHPSPDSKPQQALWDLAPDYLGLSVEHGLALNLEQKEDGIVLELTIRDDLLSSEGTSQLVRQVDALVTAMVQHPDEPIEELTKYFPRELISISEDTSKPFDPVVTTNNPTCWLEHWAKVSPDWPAAEIALSISPGHVDSVSWSYSELNAAANRVASFLLSRGIYKRAIAHCLGRTLQSFAVISGIMKSGNIYLPIDEGLPDDRKVFLLQDSSVRILFTTKQLRPAINPLPGDCEVVDVEDTQFQDELSTHSTENPIVDTAPDDELYLLYTSGSTGLPKGCVIMRSNLVCFVEHDGQYIQTIQPACLELGGKGKFFCLASRAFDVHLAEIFLGWKWGLCAVTGNRSMLLDDLELALRELHVSHACFVPSLIDQVQLRPDDVPDMRYLSVGGEKISAKTLAIWGSHDRVVLANAYGPTEVTIGCTAALVHKDSNVRNIGTGFGDTIAHVLRPGTFTYVKKGMEGELCFTGSLVGKGYHKRPDAKGFVESFHGERMYRTGDLVRMMPDNTLEIFGRSDDQTKIRGQRLELGEVSECVRQLATSSGDVSTLIVKHPALSKPQLVSFFADSKRMVSPAERTTINRSNTSAATIRAGCKKKLPGYMVPDFIIPLDFLPLAAMSGKFDVKQLRALFAALPLEELLAEGSQTQTEPSREFNDKEKKIMEILQTVIRADFSNATPATNIFEMGVDSLSAISLAAKLRQAGYDCSVSSVMDLATIEKLATLQKSHDAEAQKQALTLAREAISLAERSFRDSTIEPEFKESVEAVMPCLPLQEAVVARTLNNDSLSLYVNHIQLKLLPDIDVERLYTALGACVFENPILRTCFCQFGDQIMQVVIQPEKFALPWKQVDMAESNGQMQDETARDIIDNIQRIPPIRINLLAESSTQEKRLCVSLHHSVYDAESLTLLLQEITDRYNGQSVPKRPDPRALVEHVLSQDRGSATAFWTALLKDLTPVHVASGPADTTAGASERRLKAKLSALEASASKLKVTLPSLAQAAFGLAMAQVAKVNDLAFGLVLGGRSIPVPGIASILAPCITTIPQRIDLRRNGYTATDLLTAIQNSAGQLIEHQHTALRDIHRWIAADRPIFDCLFSFIKTNNGSKPNLWTEFSSDMELDYPFAIEFEACQASDELIMRVGFMASFGALSKVDGLLEMIELLVEQIISGANPRVQDLGIKPGQVSRDSNADNEPQEWSDLELQIRAALPEVSDVPADQLLRKTTFFRLGIDSVVSIRFAQILRKRGLRVASSDVLRYASIAALAEHLSSATPQEPQTSHQTTQPESADVFQPLTEGDRVVAVYNCTPLQTGTLSQTISTDGKLYVHHHSVRLLKNVDLARLKGAWERLVQSHDILRTSFHLTERIETPWVAVVHEQVKQYWNEVETATSEMASAREIMDQVQLPDAAAFASPPWRTTLIKSPEETLFIISMHHSLYDGWSLPTIFQQLTDTYAGSSLPSATPFWRAAQAITQGQKESVDFWLKRLDGYESIEMPSVEGSSAAFSTRKISVSTSQLMEKCKRLNITLQTAALLAYGKALCSIVERRDVVFGQVLSGRTLPLDDVENINGPLFNTIPVRIQFDNTLLTNEAAALRLQQESIDGQSHQHAALGSVQSKWRKSARTSKTLLDSLFVYQKGLNTVSDSAESLWEPVDLGDDKDATEYGLNVEIEENEKSLTVRAASPAGKLGQERLNNFLETFEAAMVDLVDSPYRSVTAFPPNLAQLPVTSSVVESTEDDTFDNDPAVDIIRAALSKISNVPLSAISPKTSIYAIGIDSILAIQVALTCRRESVALKVSDVLLGNSPSGIARILRSKETQPAKAATRKSLVSEEVKEVVLSQVQYSNEDVLEVVPCLPGQAYHLASWLNAGRTFYEPVWSFRSEKLDEERLRQAWSSVRERYPILRTVFAVAGGDAYQVVLKPSAMTDESFSVVDGFTDLEIAAKDRVAMEALHPRDLFTPPNSICLVRGTTEDAVLLKLHHSTYDPWTMTALVADLTKLYQQSELSPLPSFTNSVWDTKNALGQLDEKSYWQSSLKGAKPTLVPAKADQPPATLAQSFVYAPSIIGSVDSLAELCRENNVALSTIIIIAFARALAELAQTEDSVTFGFFRAGRSGDLDGIPGPCVNLLPLAVRLKDCSVADLASSIQKNLNKQVDYEQSDLRDVLRWISNDNASPQPLFNASLNLLWHDSSAQVQANDQQSSTPLFKPLSVGFPTEFASQEPLTGTTAVDALDTRYLAAQNLFCDVGPNPATNSMDFGVKCDAALMSEEDVQAFIHRVVAELERCVEELRRK